MAKPNSRVAWIALTNQSHQRFPYCLWYLYNDEERKTEVNGNHENDQVKFRIKGFGKKSTSKETTSKMKRCN